MGSTVTEHLFKDSRGAHIQVTAWAEDMNHHPLQFLTCLSSEKRLQLLVREEETERNRPGEVCNHIEDLSDQYV